MQHFDLTNWVDYARGVASLAASEAMARHLAEGCESCSRTAALAGRIQAQASAEVDPPASWVQRAKAGFPAALPEMVSWPRLAARLFFPGEQLAAAGVRSAPQPSRNVVCRAGDYCVELHVEREPESIQLVVVGQAANTAAGGGPLR